MSTIITKSESWQELIPPSRESYDQSDHTSLLVLPLENANRYVVHTDKLSPDCFLIFDIELSLFVELLDQYRHSKVYFATEDGDFSEEKTLWFQLQKTNDRQCFLLYLPPEVRAIANCKFMIDAVPFSPRDSFRLHQVSIGDTNKLLHWISVYNAQITPQAVQLAGQLSIQSAAKNLVSLLARKLRTGSFEIDYQLTNSIIHALEIINDDESLKQMIDRLDVHNYHYQWGSLDKAMGCGLIAGNQNGEEHRLLLGQYNQAPYVELELSIEIDWTNTRHYEFSKLYFDFSGLNDYSEERVVCFRASRSAQREKLAIRLPSKPSRSGIVSLRLDPLPGCTGGKFSIFSCRTLNADEIEQQLQTQANLDYQKQQTRKAVIESEDQQLSPIAHLPESISLELTPRCDFTCGHCSSHGTKELHDEYNRMPVFPEADLDKLAKEVFPSLSTLTIVGRGEPSIVPERYWQKLMGHLRENRTRFTMVTHGYHLPRRITEENIDLVDTITISIDGITQETFAKNRGGKELERVLNNAAYYHELRKKSKLMKRPRLCFSWTLLKNNIHEFPDFVRYVVRFEPEMLYVRHLLVYHSKDLQESLFDEPERANHYLREAYSIMEKHNIRGDCPPLFNSVDIELSKHSMAKPVSDKFEVIQGKQIDETIPVMLGSFQKTGAAYVQVELSINLDADATKQYQHGKLYYDFGNRRQFSEEQVICFRVPKNNSREIISIRLPAIFSETEVVGFRLDPIPDCHNSSFEIFNFKLLREDEINPVEKQKAEIDYLRKEARKAWMEVSVSDTENESFRQHFVLINLPFRETTNLEKQLQRIPVSVGIMIADRNHHAITPGKRWPELFDSIRHHRRQFNLTTIGHILPAFITRETIDLVDSITVLANQWLVDEFSSPVIARLFRNIEKFCDLRSRSNLTRRPRLLFNWELDEFNAGIFPDFVESVIRFDPDAFNIREVQGVSCSNEAISFLVEGCIRLLREGITFNIDPLLKAKLKDADVKKLDIQPGLEEEVANPQRNTDYKCVYMHRTGVVMSNGDVNTCAAPYVKIVGSLQEQSFRELWLGKDMQNLRHDIGTEKEWKQCSNCWFREINYKSQRRERHDLKVFDYSEGSQYSLDAWDFRGYEGRTDIIAKG